MTTDVQTGNLMAPTWSKASVIRRAFKAGRRRKSDLIFEDIEEAVLAAYTSFLELRKEMRKAGLPSEDVRAAISLMTAYFQGPPFNAGVVMLYGVPDTLMGLPDLLTKVKMCAGKGEMCPLGIAFWQRDRDPKAKEKSATWMDVWTPSSWADRRIASASDATFKLFGEIHGEVPEGGLADTFEEKGF